MEWKPIETAPKDGTEVLLRVKSQHGEIAHVVAFLIDESWEWLVDWNHDAISPLKPTHWMPLPEPPKEDAK